MNTNYNTDIDICQAVGGADEMLAAELESKFAPKKSASEVLAQSYDRIGYERKAERVEMCGTFLEFAKPLGDISASPSAAKIGEEASGESERWKLHNANFCRDRLCPMCSWRRTYKIFGQISRIMNVIEDDYAFIFLTLTVPNCKGDELSGTIDRLQYGWNKLTKYKRFKTAVKGYFKVLETTRNTNKRDKSYNTYHPHFHVILAVSKSYFSGREYMAQSEWLALWRKAMQDPTITQVDVRRCKDKRDIRAGEQAVKTLGSAVAEVAKYSVKSADFLGRFEDGKLVEPFPDDEIDEVVTILSAALHCRRLTALGGIFEKIAKQLQLDDCEDGDLIHVDGEELRPDVAYMIRRYGWSAGAYKLIEERREVNIIMEVDEL